MKIKLPVFIIIIFLTAAIRSVACDASFSFYASPTNPDSIHFYPTGQGNVSWYWTFGDNTSSTQQYPWHYYISAGTYYVCLTVVTASGDTCDHCDSVHVNVPPPPPPCNANFSFYTLNNNPDSVHFYPSSTNNVAYYWTFGDNTSSTQITPWHFYSSSGTYWVCLTVVTASGDTCDHCDSVHVNVPPPPPPCNANFSFYTLNNNPDSVHFYPSSTSNVLYYWTFGDNTSSTLATPWHFYSSAGTYWVCLTVVTASGDTCDHCDSVNVNGPPPPPPCNANFYHYSSQTNPDSVHFYPLGSNIISWYWTFGDNTSSTQQDPWHLYSSAGTYYACLTVITASGDTCDHCDSVNVSGPPPPPPCNANFSLYTLNNNPDSVHFYPSSTSNVAYYWTFGDNTSSTQTTPWHFYSSAGTYWVCLTVITASGDTCDHCDSVHVNGVPPPPPCNANFSFYTLNNNPDSVHFYPSSTSNVAYYWTFGDNTSSTQTTPWHFYSSAGTYWVCLTVITASGDTCDHCDSVHVNGVPPPPPCNANFYHYSLQTNPDSVHFYPLGSNIISWYWTFGDNTSSTQQDPWHLYASAGTYYACLTVITASGDTCDHCDSVHVNGPPPPPPCNANFSFYTINSNPDSVHFYPASTSNVSYYWTFGDNTSSTQSTPWHFYSSAGTYWVCLTVVTASGDTCDHCDSVHVNGVPPPPPCNANFYHYSLQTNPDSVHFYPLGSNIISWYWTFGDNTSSTQQDPWHLYASAGTYYACLTVITASGDTCDHCDSVHVNGPPPPPPCNANFSFYTINSNPDSVHFYPASTSNVSYYWTFGDNTSSTLATPWHFYSSAGTYWVCLTVVTASGDTCDHCDSVHVNGPPPPPPPCNANFYHYLALNLDSVHFYPAMTGATSYFWTFGDNSTSSNYDPWHLYGAPGVYYVCLTVITTSGDTCTHCDSVHVGGMIHYHVYPNPSNEYTTLDILDAVPVSFILYDMRGQIIYRRDEMSSGTYTFSTANISNGIYYYRIMDGTNNVSHDRLVIFH